MSKVSSKIIQFEPGDIVKIREGTIFYNQAPDIPGFIDCSIDRLLGSTNWYKVVFYNGYKNSYRGQDLELVKSVCEKTPNLNSEVIKLLKK